MSGYTVSINTGIATGQNIIHSWIEITKPDGAKEAWGFYPQESDVGNMIYGPGDVRPESPGATPTATSGPIPITESQYRDLSQYIQQSDITPPNYSIPLGSQCTNWALMALAEAGIIPRVLGPDAGWGPLQTLIWNPLWQQVAWFYRDLFNRAKRWTYPRDPILLDLDGDGLETVGLSANIHFDFDADGVLTGTGWAGKDDALLVWDRNANGQIEAGGELFGDFTELPNGTLAPNGFAALAALDTNGDGLLDAADPAFAELKLWRDTSQDGQTAEGELISLSEAGIESLKLAHTLTNQRLANGNQLSREGSFTRADGSTSAMGEFRLATDTFDTRFAEQIDLGLRSGDIAPQHPALAASLDARRNQHRTIDDAAFEADFLVAGIQKQVGHLAQGAFPPGLESFIELGRGAAHLGAGEPNLRPQEPLQDVDDAAGGHSLDVHLGQGEIDRLIGAGTFLQGGRIEIAGTHLRHRESHLTQPGEHGLGLEAVGVVAPAGLSGLNIGKADVSLRRNSVFAPGRRALVGRRANKLAALDLGGLVDEDAQRFSSTVQSMLEQRGIRRLQGIGFDSHRHDAYTPFSKSWPQDLPPRRFTGRTPSALRACAPRPVKLPASDAQKNLQKERYTTGRSRWRRDGDECANEEWRMAA